MSSKTPLPDQQVNPSGNTDQIEQMLTTGEPVVSDIWPEIGEFTALPAFERHGAEAEAQEIHRRLGSLKAFQKLKRCPILGICGGLNAGKSSVVRIFLSTKGRERVPCGLSDIMGTHRFVLWLPQSWLDEPDMRQALDDLISEVFGSQREMLSDDIKEAHRQYNNVSLLEVPLLAGDSQLDTLQMGLLDCPDIMTDPPEKRLALLARGSALCSALVVVLLRSQVRSKETTTNLPTAIAKGAPSAPRYLLINQLDPTENLAELLPDVRYHCSGDHGCYVAMHFRISPGWKEKTPPDLLPDFNEAEPHRIPLPWRLDDSEVNNVPNAVQPERFFKNLPSQLDAAALFKTKMNECREIILKQVRIGFEGIEKRMDKDGKEFRSTHAGLCELLQEQMTDKKGNAKNIVTFNYVLPLLASLERTAPGWIRPIIWLKKPFKPLETFVNYVKDKVGGSYESLAKKAPPLIRGLMGLPMWPLRKLLQFLGAQESEEEECKIEVSSLVRCMKNSRWCPSKYTDQELTVAWEDVLRHAISARLNIPSAEKFDEITKDVWKVLPWHKQAIFAIKQVAQLAVLTGALIAAAAEAVVTFGHTGGAGSFIFGVALSKIITGSLIGGAAGGVASVTLNAFFFDTNTLPYLSAMIAYACDVFGIPRKVDPTKAITIKWGETILELPDFTEPNLPVSHQLVEGGRLGRVNESAKLRLMKRLESDEMMTDPTAA